MAFLSSSKTRLRLGMKRMWPPILAPIQLTSGLRNSRSGSPTRPPCTLDSYGSCSLHDSGSWCDSHLQYHAALLLVCLMDAHALADDRHHLVNLLVGCTQPRCQNVLGDASHACSPNSVGLLSTTHPFSSGFYLINMPHLHCMGYCFYSAT